MMDVIPTTWNFNAPAKELSQQILAGIGMGGVLLEGGVSSPMSGSTQEFFESLEDLELFLMPINAVSVTSSFRSSFHYVDPESMIRWIRDEIGDTELASCLEEIDERGLVYAQEVPLFKSALQERIAQHKEVLGMQQGDGVTQSA